MKINIIFSSYQFSLWKDLKANNKCRNYFFSFNFFQFLFVSVNCLFYMSQLKLFLHLSIFVCFCEFIYLLIYLFIYLLFCLNYVILIFALDLCPVIVDLCIVAFYLSDDKK